MPEYFVLALTAGTSALAIAAGVILWGLPVRDLPAAVARTLEIIGLALVFCVLNLLVGGAVLLLGRVVSRGFLSLYLANDVTLVICSFLQALVFQRWRERSSAPVEPVKRRGSRG